MARIFVYDGREFPDPDPSLTPDQVRQNYSGLLPVLANADVTHETRGEADIYSFHKRVGTKG